MASDERIFIGLGANLGDARATIAAVITELGNLSQTAFVAGSSLYRSAALEAEGPDYVNAVVELRSTLEPEALLVQLQILERRYGRERPFRYAPRTLDLDLLIYGRRCVEAPMLTVPHPRLHLRAFVLAPLTELAPDLGLADGRTAAQALADLRDQDIERIVE
jgi:2-amino-4-hydroxy-6-hydroxymethyldihydropteridine diphosphokinase